MKEEIVKILDEGFGERPYKLLELFNDVCVKFAIWVADCGGEPTGSGMTYIKIKDKVEYLELKDVLTYFLDNIYKPKNN